MQVAPQPPALPLEIKLEILKHLPTRDAMAAEQISTDWASAARLHWDDQRSVLVHRAYGDRGEQKKVLCERDRMLASLFPPVKNPIKHPPKDPLRVVKELRAYSNATVLVAWSAVAASVRHQPHNARRIIDLLLSTEQISAGLDALGALWQVDPDGVAETYLKIPSLISVEQAQGFLAACSGDSVILDAVYQDALRSDGPVLLHLVQHYPPASDLAWRVACCAIKLGHMPLLQSVLIYVCEDQMNALLLEAVKANNVAAARFLMDAGADRESLRPMGQALFMDAVRRGHCAAACWLGDWLAWCVSENPNDGEIWEALFAGAKDATAEQMSTLLEKCARFAAGVAHATAEVERDGGRVACSVLYAAMDSLAPESPACGVLCTWLMQHDVKTTFENLNPEIVLKFGDAALLRSALQRGLTLSYRVLDEDGVATKFSVHLLEAGQAAWIRLLAEAGHDFTQLNSYGHNALTSLVLEAGWYKTGSDWYGRAKALCDAGCDPDALLGGEPLLMNLANSWDAGVNIEVARALLESGAEVHLTNAQGQTALHMAGTAAMQQLLLQHGARADALDYRWRRPRLL